MTEADPQHLPMTVRDRRPEDLQTLLSLLERTHEQDGYPVRAAAVRIDWLAAPSELEAAVAVIGCRVVGHVALHEPNETEDAAAVRQWQRAVRRPPDELAVVSRLFTDRTVRGAGTALLREALVRAALLGRTAVLLADPDSPALHFYLRRGWQQIGAATQHWGHRTVQAALLVQPEIRVKGHK